MTKRLLMTADAVGGVWQYATDLAGALAAGEWEVTIAVLGPATNEGQRTAIGELSATRSASTTPAKAGAQSRRPHEQDATQPAWAPASAGVVAGAAVTLVETNLPLDWLCTSPDPVLAAAQTIATLARDLDADLVHLNTPALACARFDVPVVVADHGTLAPWWEAANATPLPPELSWQFDLAKRGLYAADAIVTPSAAHAATVARLYALTTPPDTVHNGRSPLPLPTGIARSDHAFTAGRLWDQVKNTPVLDRVAARLPVPFHAAGPTTGPHGQTATPAHLTCLGRLDEAALARELATRPIFVSAARFEPFGLAVLEAANAACALVLSDIATFRELWDGAALFVPADDDRAHADAITRLLDDAHLREDMEHAARTRARRYTPAAMATAMVAIYDRVLAPARQAAA